MNLAIFDLDHTLLPLDCEWHWINFVATKAGLNPKDAFAPLKPLYADYYERHILDSDAFSDFQLHFMARFERRQLDLWRSEFVKEEIVPVVSEKAINLVKTHQKKGDKTVVCSGTYAYLVEPIATFFDFDAILCGRPEMTESGNFTGHLIGLNSFGANKVVFVKNFLRKSEEKFEKLYFYSDSLNDKPLFDFVDSQGGICVATNADADLLSLAKKRGWETLTLYETGCDSRGHAVRQILGV